MGIVSDITKRQNFTANSVLLALTLTLSIPYTKFFESPIGPVAILQIYQFRLSFTTLPFDWLYFSVEVSAAKKSFLVGGLYLICGYEDKYLKCSQGLCGLVNQQVKVLLQESMTSLALHDCLCFQYQAIISLLLSGSWVLSPMRVLLFSVKKHMPLRHPMDIIPRQSLLWFIGIIATQRLVTSFFRKLSWCFWEEEFE